MSLIVTCQCGRQFMASADLAGKRVPCPACGGEISVPLQETAASSAAVSGPPIVVACVCGGRFQAPPHLLGKRVPCPSCGQAIHVVRSTAEEPLAPAAFDDSSFAAAPVSPPPRARGGAWAHSHRREEPVNMRPVIIAASIGGGAVVLLILAMVVTSLLPSGDGAATSESDDSTTTPSISQPSTVTTTGPGGNAALPISTPKQDTAARLPQPTAARPDEGPATTIEPPVSSLPAVRGPSVQENRETPAKEAPALLIGGLPVPVAKAFAEEYEALFREVWNETLARAKTQGANSQAELTAIAKSVGREKQTALMAKYRVGAKDLGEIVTYAVDNGWIDPTGPFERAN
jgi:hypothetical protein